MNIRLSEADTEASICKDSFAEFVKSMWETVIPEELEWNWHMTYLCDELQAVAERVFKNEPKLYDLIINIPPGTTKSTIASQMFPAWIWTRKASAKIICGSYTHSLSEDFSRKTRDILTSEKFQSLFPDIRIRKDHAAVSYFGNNRFGMRFCTGTEGSVTGMHGHFIIIDDPIDPKRAASKADLKAANKWITQTLQTRKIKKSVTPTILIMQRLSQDDPSGHLLDLHKKTKAIKHICIPAELSSDVKPKRLIKFYKDRLLDPNRLSRTVLKEAETTLGQYGYAGQFQQNPIPASGGMFKVARLKKDQPQDRKFKTVVRYWDKAGTDDDPDAAWTVGTKMAVDSHGRFWVLDVVRGQWESSEREDVIFNTAKNDGRSVIIGIEQEPGSGGKESAQTTVRRLAGYRVITQRPSGNKVVRADPFSVQVNSGNVYLVPAAWNQEYIDELQYFPNSKFKDQVDASSGAFSLLTNKTRKVGPVGNSK